MCAPVPKLAKLLLLILLLILFCPIYANNNKEIPELKIFKEYAVPKQMGVNPFKSEQNQARLFSLHYADAAKIAKLLTSKNSGLLSKTGHVVLALRINGIWVTDSPKKIKLIAQFINQIDVSVPQIAIAARIVSVDSNFVQELGIKFGTVAATGIKDGSNLTIEAPATAITPGHFAFTIGRLGEGTLLDAELEALQSEGKGKVISRPRLITLNRQPAVIESGEEIPYQEKTGEGDTSVAFKKAVLGLKVTPQILSPNKILLKIAVNQDKVSSLTINGVPAIQTREITTHVLVHNRETIVLGGIYEESKHQVVTKVPFLGSIPILGYLFRDKKIQTERKELLIFITPKIKNP